MITLQEKDNGAVLVTLGDRNADGKVDLTVEAAVRVPSLLGGTLPGFVQQLVPITENVPIEQAAAVLKSVAAGAVPAIGGGLGFIFHAVGGALHLP